MITNLITFSVNRPIELASAARVYALTGERNRALERLEALANVPCGPTYGDLLLSPYWDSLRNDPRFGRVLAAAKSAGQ